MSPASDGENRSVNLVAEDEESSQDALNIGLTIQGFVVVGATNIAPARQLMTSTKPDRGLLDIMLPDGSSIDYCGELYDAARPPVIVMTARSSEVNVVLGLEIGAADYVIKPLRLRELVARACAVLRRPLTLSGDEIVDFGDLRIDFVRRTVTHCGKEIENDSSNPRHLIRIRGVGFRLDP